MHDSPREDRARMSCLAPMCGERAGPTWTLSNEASMRLVTGRKDRKEKDRSCRVSPRRETTTSTNCTEVITVKVAAATKVFEGETKEARILTKMETKV